MYTRTYDDKRGILIPESYGGTLLFDGITNENAESSHGDEMSEMGSSEAISEDMPKENVPTFAPLSKIKIPNFLSNIFKNGNLSLQKLGTEEILIIATATFLFFSKDGDKECAILLLLLLFLG